MKPTCLMRGSFRVWRGPRGRSGVTYIELLISVLLLGIAATGAIATWGISARLAAAKRLTEMGSIVCVTAMEQVKDEKYLNLPADTPTASPNMIYYDKNGARVTSASAGGYTAEWWMTTLVNRNSITDTEDLREVKVKVFDNTVTHLYDTGQTMVTFGGL